MQPRTPPVATSRPSPPSISPIGTMVYPRLDRITPSPLNQERAKGYDQAALQELADSIKSVGVREPAIVRLVKNTLLSDPCFELVCGERRWTASKLAGKETLPCLVQDLSDADVLAIMLIENLQREDLSPLDEALAYQRMIKELGWTVDQVSEKVGKQKRTIYARLQLCRLAPAVADMLRSGKIDASRGLLLARIPDPKQQAKAMKEILDLQYGYNGPMSSREAEEFIQCEYMTDLRKTPFALNDAKLLISAGACTTCPNNLRNMGDNGDRPADRCTDPACYTKKVEAFQLITLAEYKAKGATVITMHQANETSKYVALESCCYDDRKRRSYETLLRKQPVPVCVAVDDNGHVHRVIARTDAAKALKEAGYKFAEEVAKDIRRDRAYDAADARNNKRDKIRRAVALSALGLIAEAAEHKIEDQENFWRLLLELVKERATNPATNAVTKRRGWKSGWPSDITDVQARGLALELLACGFEPYAPYLGYSTSLKEACAFFHVDLKKLEKEAAASAGKPDNFATALHKGTVVRITKEANAIRVVRADGKSAIVLASDASTLKGSGPYTRAEAGIVSFAKGKPLWATFGPVKP